MEYHLDSTQFVGVDRACISKEGICKERLQIPRQPVTFLNISKTTNRVIRLCLTKTVTYGTGVLPLGLKTGMAVWQ